MKFDGQKKGFTKVASITVKPKNNGSKSQKGLTLEIQYVEEYNKKDKCPCVYFMETNDNDIFYVGLANKGMSSRLNQHKGGCESGGAAKKLLQKYRRLHNNSMSIDVWATKQFDIIFKILGESLTSNSIELFEQSLIVLLKETYKKSLVNFTRDAVITYELEGGKL